MNIVIATPLFPPDIATPAPYSKELATRLSQDHTVSVVLYGRLPEAAGSASFLCTTKNRLAPLRLISYTYTLWRSARTADVILAQNGAAVELPIILISLFTNARIMLRLGDQTSLARNQSSFVLRTVERFARHRASVVLIPNERLRTKPTDTIVADPLSRPEWLPFSEGTETNHDAYEASWHTHISTLMSLIT